MKPKYIFMQMYTTNSLASLTIIIILCQLEKERTVLVWFQHKLNCLIERCHHDENFLFYYTMKTKNTELLPTKKLQKLLSHDYEHKTENRRLRPTPILHAWIFIPYYTNNSRESEMVWDLVGYRIEKLGVECRNRYKVWWNIHREDGRDLFTINFFLY